MPRVPIEIGRFVPCVILVEPGLTSVITTRDAGEMDAHGIMIREIEITELFGAATM